MELDARIDCRNSQHLGCYPDQPIPEPNSSSATIIEPTSRRVDTCGIETKTLDREVVSLLAPAVECLRVRVEEHRRGRAVVSPPAPEGECPRGQVAVCQPGLAVAFQLGRVVGSQLVQAVGFQQALVAVFRRARAVECQPALRPI